MPIKMRLAQDVPERAGEDGADGTSGADGEAGAAGADGVNLTAPAPQYPAADASQVIFIQGSGNVLYHIELESDGCIIGFPGSPDGTYFRLIITQDSVGSRTVFWSGDLRWEGGAAPALSSNPYATDIIEVFCYRPDLVGLRHLARVVAQGIDNTP